MHGRDGHRLRVARLSNLNQLPNQVFVGIAPVEPGVARFYALPLADVLKEVKLWCGLSKLMALLRALGCELTVEHADAPADAREFCFGAVG